MKTLTYSIPNISCGHCVMHVKQTLKALEGVLSVEGLPQDKQITVEFTDPATDELIRKTLASIDYPAQI
jgi:copper chaperone